MNIILLIVNNFLISLNMEKVLFWLDLKAND